MPQSSKDSPAGPFPARVAQDETAKRDYDRLRRRALWSMPSGLYLVGSKHAQRRNLMTANLVCQVSQFPKCVAVSIESDSLTHELVAESGYFSLSLVSKADRALLRRFAKPAVQGADPKELGGVKVFIAATGVPILASAASWLDCAVTHTLELGSHSLFVGEVLDAGVLCLESHGVESHGVESHGVESQGDEQNEGPSISEAEQPMVMADTRMHYGG